MTTRCKSIYRVSHSIRVGSFPPALTATSNNAPQPGFVGTDSFTYQATDGTCVLYADKRVAAAVGLFRGAFWPGGENAPIEHPVTR